MKEAFFLFIFSSISVVFTSCAGTPERVEKRQDHREARQEARQDHREARQEARSERR